MKYLLIEFTKGLNQQAYQSISDDGTAVMGYLNLDGTELILPEVTESRVVDPNFFKPSWSN